MLRVAVLTSDGRELLKRHEWTSPELGAAPQALLDGFALLPGVEVHVISCLKKPVISPEKLGPNIFFHSLLVPKGGWMRTLYLGCIRAVRRKLKEIRPHIVHGQGTERECAIAAALSGYPNVVTLHGIMAEMVSVLRARPGSFYWLASLLESFSLRRTAGVFCNSHFTQESVRVRCRKTWLVPNAVRAPFFLNPPAGARPAPPILLNVGTVCTYKRQNELLDVAEQLRGEGLEFELHFLGGAPAGDAYAARFLDRVRNSSYLFYHGIKFSAELIAQYDAASALVHVSAVETFGLVVAEALARNLKFFGFASGGVSDILAGVPGAEVFADGDWEGVRESLRTWIRAGAPRAESGNPAMRRKYLPEVVARRHLEIYRDVLNSPS